MHIDCFRTIVCCLICTFPLFLDGTSQLTCAPQINTDYLICIIFVKYHFLIHQTQIFKEPDAFDRKPLSINLNLKK